MKTYDVIIIGGGVIGAAAARELSRYSLRVALLEKETELAFGVSKSNRGIIHPGTQHDPVSLKGRLCVRGNALTRRLSRELGFNFKEAGELIVAFDQEEEARLVRLKVDAEALGVPRVSIVDKTWLREHEPNLSMEAKSAVFAATAGIVSPYRMTYDLSENAAKNGVQIYTQAKVLDVIKLERGAGPRFEIVTGRGNYGANFIINAAGLYADEISGMVGVDDFKIRPRKGEEFLLDKKKENIANHLIFPLPSKTSKGILVIKTSDGNPMIGPTAEEMDDKEDSSTTDEGMNKVLSAAKRLIPSIDGDDIIAYFAGLRPAAGDDFIIRHESKAPGFINAAGMQSPGLTAAPAVAEMIIGILRSNGLSLKKKIIFHRHRRKTVHLSSIPISVTKRLIRKDKDYGDIVCRCEMVSSKEIKDAIRRGARTLDGIKFRTRAQAGRCHGSFCTTRLLKILSFETARPVTEIAKMGSGSELIMGERKNARA
jgi:glycerol-3-phosphate dehydrogenase